ncbi:MAG: ADP-ribosylglycohydrolase family protein [Pirellulaceae bacterium]
MHSTHLRREHIHGLMVGTAIGDALGYAREGLSRRVALKMFGRPPLRYRLLPGRGIYSDDTQLMLMAAQALLNSRSEVQYFRHSLRRRLSWYVLSLPVGIGRATLLASLKCWPHRVVKLETGVNSAGNGPATRALFLGLALNDTGNRIVRWVEESTKITHTHPLALDGCRVLATLANAAATTSREKLDPGLILKQLVELSSEPKIRDRLSQLDAFLQQRRSPSAVARHFGWHRGISGFIVPTTIMATYCWMRYPDNFCRAVESAIALGGDSDSLGAIVGGLVGGHVGIQGLPDKLVATLGGFPHGPQWMADTAERFAHWPHGVDDLHIAPARPADPLMQFARNLFAIPLVLAHIVLRIPWRLCTRATPKRLST